MSSIPQNVLVLGSTGSIGRSTLDVLRAHPARFKVHSLVAGSNVEQMLADCLEFEPQYAHMADSTACAQLASRLAGKCSTEVVREESAAIQLAEDRSVDIVMAAIVGAAGLLPTYAAVKSGKRVLLANKEALVTAGSLFMEAAVSSGARLLPIDSEHNAIFQCLPDTYSCGERLGNSIKQILLTASGGPFRGWSHAQLETVTPSQACAHPNWSMGQKISVDSASLMNKGLELIEACWLFNVDSDRINVHVHPESVIHSMVSYVDGSVIAQMGCPDMRTPIAYGLAWPDRIEAGVETLDLFEVAKLNFERPDHTLFPCLNLAKESFNAGGSASATLNAANEVAVEAFLKGNIGFLDIPDIIQSALERVENVPLASIDDVMEVDHQSRIAARKFVDLRSK